MKLSRRALLLTSVLASAVALPLVACGDDDAIVRQRPDGGNGDATTTGDAEDVDSTVLGCGVTIPTTYDSTGYTTNAAVELALKESTVGLEDKMKTAEGATGVAVTLGDLNALYAQGTPSLRAVSTANAQTLVDLKFAQFADASQKTWTPADADVDGGAAAGGKYENTFIFGPTGVDLRETSVKVILTGALYNHALGIVSAPLTPASVDRLLAVFGASPSFANRTDPDAGELADELVAEYASRRDNDNAPSGPYRKIRDALLTLKAAVPAGDKCKKEIDDAVATYFAEWEKASLATSIYYLNAAVVNATAGNKNPSALHGFGEALGFIEGWKGIPQDKRKITDAQVDSLLQKIGADSPYKLVLVSYQASRVLSINGAINDIATIYGFSAAEVEAFKTNY